jgi:hypothetical protein
MHSVLILLKRKDSYGLVLSPGGLQPIGTMGSKIPPANWKKKHAESQQNTMASAFHQHTKRNFSRNAEVLQAIIKLQYPHRLRHWRSMTICINSPTLLTLYVVICFKGIVSRD